MSSDRYAQDVAKLILEGNQLLLSMEYECNPDSVRRNLMNKHNDEKKVVEDIDQLPVVSDFYQTWYSEAKALLEQVLPDRLDDFTRHYERPRNRKRMTVEDYVVEDYLQGLVVDYGIHPVRRSAAIPRMRQQVAIVSGVSRTFSSSLFDIRQLLRADLFDSEIDMARELSSNGFIRASGAVAGVVLEKHLKEVCKKHKLLLRRKNITISIANDALKEASIIDLPDWRRITYLGDLRNRCTHADEREPTEQDVVDLIDGAARVTKTVF